MAIIQGQDLRKTFGAKFALEGIDLRVDEGRIIGLIGCNGAGKSTLLNAIVGLTPCGGQLRVLDRDPWKDRDRLMRDICFISDVAVLPLWMRVSQALDYVEGVHPRFDREKAERFLTKTTIHPKDRIKVLSKGMVTQLHLALVMAIDAKLMVLDEPTLGLDLVYRKQFFDALLGDCFDNPRTVIVATHEVQDIQHILTDVIFLDRGRVVLDSSVDDLQARFVELFPGKAHVAAARALNPIRERQGLALPVFLFDGVARDRLSALGEVRAPSLADLFVSIVGGDSTQGKAS